MSMTKLMLSKILAHLSEYNVINQQLFRIADNSYLDLSYSTLDDQLIFFLYGISSLCKSYDDLYIVNDILNSEDDFEPFSKRDYEKIEPMLGDFGIHTSSYVDVNQIREFKVLTLADCKAYEPNMDSVELLVFISDVHTVTQQAACVSFAHEWQKTYPTLMVCNASISQAVERSTEELESISADEHTLVIDGRYSLPSSDKKFIFWRICQTTDSAIHISEYQELYKELSYPRWTTICLQSDALIGGSNPLAEEYAIKSNCQLTQHISFPVRFLYLLALLHVVHHKQIEFIKFADTIEDEYLKYVELLFSCRTDSIYDQLQYFSSIEEGKIYVIKSNTNYQPALMKEKHMDLNFRACPLDVIISSIKEVLDGHVPPETVRDFPGNYTISIGSGDFSTIDVLTSDDLNLIENSPELKLYTFRDTLSILASVVPYDNANFFENYLYKILRYIEQKLFEYKKLFNLSNLIAFEYRGTQYIGAAEVTFHYDVDAYFCTSKLYTRQCTVTKILPATVMFAQDESLAVGDLSTIDFVRDNIPEFLEGMLTYFMFAQPTDAVSEIIRRFYLNDNLSQRVHDWDKLKNIFTSYGLRDLDTYYAPINIYGGCNAHIIGGKRIVEVCAIAFEPCPYQGGNI